MAQAVKELAAFDFEAQPSIDPKQIRDLAASRWIDVINERFGRIANWLVLLACVAAGTLAWWKFFKTEEQARVEDTMDGAQSIVDEQTSLDWPTSENAFASGAAVAAPPADEAAPQEVSDESLWSRSRDFDWGD